MKEHPTKMTVTCLKDTNITEKVLRDYFGTDSTIKSVQFPLNMATGEKIGFALMELESHHDVEKFASKFFSPPLTIDLFANTGARA